MSRERTIELRNWTSAWLLGTGIPRMLMPGQYTITKEQQLSESVQVVLDGRFYVYLSSGQLNELTQQADQ